MSDDDPTPGDHIERLRETYICAEHVPNDIAVGQFIPVGTGRADRRRQRIRDLADALADVSPCSIAFDALVDGPEGSASSKKPLTYQEIALAYAAVLVDVTTRYPAIDRAGVTRRLNRSLRGSPDVTTLAHAGAAVVDLGRTVAAGERLLASLDPEAFVHPNDTPEHLRSLVHDRIETGDPAAVASVRDDLETATSRNWTREDLLRFEPIEFERLLATCWREYRNAATTTRARQDKGIDVVVRTADDDRLLVQAKRYSPGNTVGVAEVQRVAGLLEEFDADRCVVVTSSTFTRSATDSAVNMERVSLVDGERLCTWLSNAQLAPPISVD
jgi:hypothetical protein